MSLRREHSYDKMIFTKHNIWQAFAIFDFHSSLQCHICLHLIFTQRDYVDVERTWVTCKKINHVDIRVARSSADMIWTWFGRWGICRSLSYTENNFKCLCHISVEEWYTLQIYIYYQLKKLGVLINKLFVFFSIVSVYSPIWHKVAITYTCAF